MRTTAQALTTAAVTITLVLASGATAGAAPRTSSHRDTHIVTARISRNGRVELPRSIRPGYRHLRVTGATGHALELVAPRRHASLVRLVADYRAFSRTGLPDRPEHDFTFVGGALAGRSVYLHLARGTYYAFDASGTTLDAAHVRTLAVRGPCRSPNLPRRHATITAVGSTRWAARPRAIARRGYLEFVNASRETQLVNLLQLRPHTTLAQVKAALSDPGADPSSVTTGRYAETGVVSPGRSEVSSYRLPAGEYALLSLWPDDRTGRPHATEGMVRLITLT